ncbi:MAG TPA: XRE family transcriptional regulator [Blastocatellia bacterium]|nr:XRE family transcriptional regulator [Blastocatellia bacterium]
MLNGQRVKQAREIRKFTQIELAERVGTSQSSLAKLESDAIEWADNLVQALALQLGFPVSFFKQGIGPEFALGSLLFRCRADLPAYEKNKIRHLAALEYEICEKLAIGTRPIPLHFPTLSNIEPKEAAQITRATFGIPPNVPISHLINKLERNGVFVFPVRDVPGSFDAFSLWSDTDPKRPIVVVNINKSTDRVRLSCAHEIGHLVLHRSPSCGLAEIENEAKSFAAEFLVPEESMKSEIREPVSLTDLANLKPRWGVSIQALVFRAHELEKITSRRYRYFCEQISKLGWRTCEPAAFDIKPEIPRLLRKLAEITFGTSLNPQKIADIASLPATLAEQILAAYTTNIEVPKTEDSNSDEDITERTRNHNKLLSFSRR